MVEPLSCDETVLVRGAKGVRRARVTALQSVQLRLSMTAVFLLSASCDRDTDAQPDHLTVFAASSVADVITELGKRFEARTGMPVVVSQGSSGGLCKQLQLGIDCDVYIPADASYLDKLYTSNVVIASSRRALAGNRLVVVMTGADQEMWAEPSGLLDASLGSIAIANPEHAPAGRYAVESLERNGLLKPLEPRIINASNARLAARYVADRGVNVGIVYATDALAFKAKMSVVYRFPHGDHREIRYEGAVCSRSSIRSAASAFLAFAGSEEAGVVWRQHGFVRCGRPIESAGGS